MYDNNAVSSFSGISYNDCADFFYTPQDDKTTIISTGAKGLFAFNRGAAAALETLNSRIPAGYRLDRKYISFATDDTAQIGGGAFGSVYRGKWKGIRCAVKVIRYSKGKHHTYHNFHTLVLNELKVLALCTDTPHMVTLIGGIKLTHRNCLSV